MSLFKKLFNCDAYGCDAAPVTGPGKVTPATSQPQAKLSTDQREALRELGRKGGKARAAKRKAIAANSPAAALAKSGEAFPSKPKPSPSA